MAEYGMADAGRLMHAIPGFQAHLANADIVVSITRASGSPGGWAAA